MGKPSTTEELRATWKRRNPFWYCTIECVKGHLCNACKHSKEYPFFAELQDSEDV